MEQQERRRRATRREFLGRFPLSLLASLAEALSLGAIRPQGPPDFPEDSIFRPAGPQSGGEREGDEG